MNLHGNVMALGDVIFIEGDRGPLEEKRKDAILKETAGVYQLYLLR